MDERVEAVQRMQDHIESNLEQDISMADLSKAAGYSPWYSYRLFQSLLHTALESEISTVTRKPCRLHYGLPQFVLSAQTVAGQN